MTGRSSKDEGSGRDGLGEHGNQGLPCRRGTLLREDQKGPVDVRSGRGQGRIPQPDETAATREGAAVSHSIVNRPASSSPCLPPRRAAPRLVPQDRRASGEGRNACQPIFSPVSPPLLFQAGVVAVCAVVGPHGIEALPEILVGPLETAAAIASEVSNPGHPRFAASPNACSFARYSSSFELAGEVFVDSSKAVLPNDGPCSHSSNLAVSFRKRMGPFYSRPNPSHISVSDTSVLPTDATTNHCRNRSPQPHQERHRHKSRGSRSSREVWQIR
jgi:hypothetical protein